MKERIYNYIAENKGVELTDIFYKLNLQNEKGTWLVYVKELEKEGSIQLNINKGYVSK